MTIQRDDSGIAIEDASTGLTADVVNHDGRNRVQVGTVITSISGGISASYSKKLRYVDMNATSGGIARATVISPSAFTTVFNYSGSGLVSSWILNLETKDDWLIKFIVDGDEIFMSGGLDLTDVHNDAIYDLDDSGKTLDECSEVIGLFFGSHDRLIWFGPLGIPVKYNTNVTIQIARKVGAAPKKFRAGLVMLTKET